MLSIKRQTRGDTFFDIINISLLSLFALIIIYPLYFVLIASISDPYHIYSGKVWILPSGPTLDGYQRIFEYKEIWTGFANSLLYTSLFTLISVICIMMAAYPLSRKDLVGRTFFTWFFLFTIYFGGGVAPTYLVVKDLGLLNTMWAVVLPGTVGAFYIIITRSFFETTIPEEMREAASMDGCSNFGFFAKMVIPLSKPIIAVMVLYNLIIIWNGFFEALVYLTDEEKYPLSLVLRNILVQNEVSTSVVGDIANFEARVRAQELIRFGSVIVGSLPLLIIFPFIQKYFVRGAYSGSVKG